MVASVKRNFIRNIREMEEAVLPCFDQTERYLPQVGDEDDIIVDLVHSRTGKPLDFVGCQIHHQTDPSYQ